MKTGHMDKLDGVYTIVVNGYQYVQKVVGAKQSSGYDTSKPTKDQTSNRDTANEIGPKQLPTM